VPTNARWTMTFSDHSPAAFSRKNVMDLENSQVLACGCAPAVFPKDRARARLDSDWLKDG
jgi:hypothetical protein